MSKPPELREALIKRVRAATAMTCPEMADQLEARLNAPFASVKAHDPNS